MQTTHAIGLGLVGLLTYKAYDEFRASQVADAAARSPALLGEDFLSKQNRNSLDLAVATQRAQDSYRYAIGALAVGALTAYAWNRR